MWRIPWTTSSKSFQTFLSKTSSTPTWGAWSLMIYTISPSHTIFTIIMLLLFLWTFTTSFISLSSIIILAYPIVKTTGYIEMILALSHTHSSLGDTWSLLLQFYWLWLSANFPIRDPMFQDPILIFFPLVSLTYDQDLETLAYLSPHFGKGLVGRFRWTT